MTILSLDDVFLEDRTVLLRIDANCPLNPETHEFLDDMRLRAVVGTINRLVRSKVVILTHQSRPGRKDFTSTSGHARELQRLLGRTVRFVDDIHGERAMQAIESLEAGDILMLDNARMDPEEVSCKGADLDRQFETQIVQRLSSVTDAFVNDAFACSHRNSPSITGFTHALPCIAGDLMLAEHHALSDVLSEPERPCIAVLGGIKVDDSVRVVSNMLENGIADEVWPVGGVANMFLEVMGYQLGEQSSAFLKNELGSEWEPTCDRIRGLLALYADRIVLPVDLAANVQGERVGLSLEDLPSEHPLMDIGVASTLALSAAIKNAGTVILNGPAGVFEIEAFSFGTIEVLNACAESDAHVVMGGGHTATLVSQRRLGRQMGHVSTGGGACLEFLAGGILPGFESLRISAKRFEVRLDELRAENR